MSHSSWQLHPNVHPMTVSTLIDSLIDLGSAAEGLLDKKSLFDTDGGWRVLQAVTRQISVPLRKLCLDNEGALLKKTIASPTFHPLGGQKGRYRRATIAWSSERREWVLTYANGKRETVVVPETKHEIEIGRLYGVDFLEDGWCSIHSPFDLMAPPVSLDAWLDTKALQVNSVSYTVKDALRLVADYEGAHTNELARLGCSRRQSRGRRQGQEHEIPLGQFGVFRMPVVRAHSRSLHGFVPHGKNAATPCQIRQYACGRGCLPCRTLDSTHPYQPRLSRTHCQGHPRNDRCGKVGRPGKPTATPRLPPLVGFPAVGRSRSRTASLRSSLTPVFALCAPTKGVVWCRTDPRIPGRHNARQQRLSDRELRAAATRRSTVPDPTGQAPPALRQAFVQPAFSRGTSHSTMAVAVIGPLAA